VGDALTVSPVTAAVTNTALLHGLLTGHAIADFFPVADPVEHRADLSFLPAERLRLLTIS
jgi:hypothetical protein